MTINVSSYLKISKLAFTFILSLALFGCGDNDKNSLSEQKKVLTYSKETILKGTVRNKKRAFKTGEIKATDSKGVVIATTQLENDKHYSIKIPENTELPILLSFSPADDKSEKNKLIAAVIYAKIKKYDINELTTLIAKKAKSLGGYTHRNMSIAADGTVGIPDANKTSTGFRGDPTRQYGGWH